MAFAGPTSNCIACRRNYCWHEYGFTVCAISQVVAAFKFRFKSSKHILTRNSSMKSDKVAFQIQCLAVLLTVVAVIVDFKKYYALKKFF